MNDSIQYIRAENVVFKKEGDRFVLVDSYKSINAAKRFTRTQPLGTVARKETIIREHGEKFYRSLMS